MFSLFLKRNNFEIYIKKLSTKLQNKKIVLYGAGSFLKFVLDNYSLNKFNIVGICDIKFSTDDESSELFVYKIITKENLIRYDFDAILISLENYLPVMEELYFYFDKIKNIKLYPLVRKKMTDEILDVWGF